MPGRGHIRSEPHALYKILGCFGLVPFCEAEHPKTFKATARQANRCICSVQRVNHTRLAVAGTWMRGRKWGSPLCHGLPRLHQGWEDRYHGAPAACPDALWHMTGKLCKLTACEILLGSFEKTPGPERYPEQRPQNFWGENRASVPFKVPQVPPM